MKITIEKTINVTTQSLKDLNTFIQITLDSKSLTELFEKLVGKNYHTLSYGFGSNHCWVKQKDINGILFEDRILFITE